MAIDVEPVVEEGAKVAVKPCGKFIKFRFTVELNPPNALIVKGIPLTFCPGSTGWSATGFSTKSGPKLAVTLLGAVILTFCGVAVPVRSPPNPENAGAPLAAALTVTTSPLLCHPLAGPIFPPVAVLTAVVKKYCVAKLAV